jgi:glutamate synthase domain-containing protein 3
MLPREKQKNRSKFKVKSRKMIYHSTRINQLKIVIKNQKNKNKKVINHHLMHNLKIWHQKNRWVKFQKIKNNKVILFHLLSGYIKHHLGKQISLSNGNRFNNLYQKVKYKITPNKKLSRIS